MNRQRVVIISLCIFLGFYLLLAATVFNHSKDLNVPCKALHVEIEKCVIEGYLTPQEVTKMIADDGLYPVGKTVDQINIRAIEDSLRAKELIETAECYKANNGNVCVRVKERIPVVRVMSDNGEDYYVDNTGNQMNKSDYVCNLIVATGHIDRNYARRVLAPIGNIVMASPLWRNQIEQINVLADSTVELVPRVGNHILYLGKPVGVTRKLERLRKFYQYGLSKAGWDQYSRISVELDNQIICKKRDTQTKKTH